MSRKGPSTFRDFRGGPESILFMKITNEMTDALRRVSARYRAMPHEDVHADVQAHLTKALGRHFPSWFRALQIERARSAIPLLGLNPDGPSIHLKGGE